MSVVASPSDQPGGGRRWTYSKSAEPGCDSTSEGTIDPFPVHLLPPSLRAITDEAARLYLLPPDLPAVLALGAISAALGQGIVLRNPPYSTAGNVFLLPSAPSGTGKSNCFRFLMEPLSGAESERIARFNSDERPRLEADLATIEAQVAGIKRDLSKPRSKVSANDEQNARERLTHLMSERERVNAQLRPARLIAEDATSQRLAMLMEQSGETIALLSSDAGDVVSNILGRWNRTERADDALLLKAFSRDPYTQDRVGRPPVALGKPCATVVLVVTPDELVNLFSVDRLSSGGLLPRFLILPSTARPQPDEGQRVPDDRIVSAWHAQILGLLDAYRWRNGEPVEVVLAEGAAAVFSRYRNEDLVDRFDEIADIAPFIARHAEQATRVALILHAAEHGSAAGSSALSIACAEAAVGLVRWFAARQMEFMRRGRRAKLEEDAGKLATLVANGAVTLRNLRDRHGFERERVLLVAREFSHVLVVEISKPGGASGGRPSEVLRMVLPK